MKISEITLPKQPTLAEDASVGGVASGAIATSMGDGAGFGTSIFMSRNPKTKTKKSKKNG